MYLKHLAHPLVVGFSIYHNPHLCLFKVSGATIYAKPSEMVYDFA